MRIILACLFLATPAFAQDRLRELCSDRPGLDTPACTVDAGHLQLEVGIGDWTRDDQAGVRQDTILGGDILARYGLGDSTELRLGWTAYGHVRTRDASDGSIRRNSGIGDITLGLKQNLAHPDGDGFSLAALPYLVVPAGGSAIGQGDWGGGLLIPLSYDLSDKVTLEMTPELDARADEDGKGRHFAYGSAGGLTFKLSDKASISGELQFVRDRDPAGHSTQALSSISFAYQPKDQLQFDIGAQNGLNHSTPDIELYFGITQKF